MDFFALIKKILNKHKFIGDDLKDMVIFFKGGLLCLNCNIRYCPRCKEILAPNQLLNSEEIEFHAENYDCPKCGGKPLGGDNISGVENFSCDNCCAYDL